jgi:cytochrome c-type biogenesis protein CcmH/NrfG
VTRRVPRALRIVVLLVAILGFYFVLLGVRGVSLLGDSRWTVRGLGLGVLLLPVVGVAVVVQELRFGHAAQRLGEQLDAEGVPVDPVAAVDPDSAFALRRAEVEAAPESWRAWYLLGVAYGQAGDVPRGRRAVRRAIALERRSGQQRITR